VRVYGRAQAIVFENEGFSGARTTITGDVSNLRGWNDRITSVQVTGRGSFGGGYDRDDDRGSGRRNDDWDRDSRGREGVCFFTEDNYRGDRYCAETGENLRNVEGRLNDRFSSVRVYGRAEVIVFEDEGFSGARTIFTRSVPNMTSWNDRITSFQVRNNRNVFGDNRADRENGRYSRGSEPRNGACFYMDEDFRGERFCLNSGDGVRNVEDRFNDRVSSIQVFGRARVTLHEHENFSGGRRTIDRDVRNLGDFNDRLTSIEVR